MVEVHEGTGGGALKNSS